MLLLLLLFLLHTCLYPSPIVLLILEISNKPQILSPLSLKIIDPLLKKSQNHLLLDIALGMEFDLSDLGYLAEFVLSQHQNTRYGVLFYHSHQNFDLDI